jgi:hypothetical protein
MRLATMQQLPRKGKKKRGSRGSGKGSADYPVSQGLGRAIPRWNIGEDTLLGLAAAQRRTLAFTKVASASTNGTGGYGEFTYQLNSAYLVDGASSATGYAKYMGFYSKCFVVGARVMARGVVINNATTHGAAVGLVVSTNNTSFAGLVPAIENGMCDWVTVFNIPDRFELNQAVDVKKFLHKPNVLDDPQLFSTSVALPGQAINLHLFIQATGTTAAAINSDIVLEFLFDCVFTDPIPFS